MSQGILHWMVPEGVDSGPGKCITMVTTEHIDWPIVKSKFLADLILVWRKVKEVVIQLRLD